MTVMLYVIMIAKIIMVCALYMAFGTCHYNDNNKGVCLIYGFWYMSSQIILRVRSMPLRVRLLL